MSRKCLLMYQKNQSKKGITCTCAPQSWPLCACVLLLQVITSSIIAIYTVASGADISAPSGAGAAAPLLTKQPQAAWRPPPGAPAGFSADVRNCNKWTPEPGDTAARGLDGLATGEELNDAEARVRRCRWCVQRRGRQRLLQREAGLCSPCRSDSSAAEPQPALKHKLRSAHLLSSARSIGRTGAMWLQQRHTLEYDAVPTRERWQSVA